MNKEIKKKWIAALNSGKYEQGTTYLNCNDKLCCLGVLCELYNDEVKPKGFKVNVISDWGVGSKFAYDGHRSYLPPVVSEWAEFEGGTQYGEYESNTEKTSLSFLNDSGKSFKFIAKVIDQHF